MFGFATISPALQEDSSSIQVDIVLDNVTNDNIKYSIGGIPKKHTGTIGIRVVAPETAIKLAASNDLDTLEYLLDVMRTDTNRDWAIHLIFESKFGENYKEINTYKDNIPLWRDNEKRNAIKRWQKIITNLQESEVQSLSFPKSQ